MNPRWLLTWWVAFIRLPPLLRTVRTLFLLSFLIWGRLNPLISITLLGTVLWAKWFGTKTLSALLLSTIKVKPPFSPIIPYNRVPLVWLECIAKNMFRCR